MNRKENIFHHSILINIDGDVEFFYGDIFLLEISPDFGAS